MTLVYSILHEEIDKNTETRTGMSGIQVRYEAEIHQKTKQKCRQRQQQIQNKCKREREVKKRKQIK